MPINQMIAAGVQQPRFESPLNMMAQVSQLRAAQDANALRQLQIQQAMRQQEQENALAALPYETLAATPQEALRHGAPGRQMYESLLKGAKEKREAELAEARIAGEHIKTSKATLGGVVDQPSYDAWRANTAKLLPGIAGALPTTFTPETVRRLALDADKLYQQVTSVIDLGKFTNVVQTPAYGGGLARPAGSFAKTPTELDVARTEQAQASAAASRAQAMESKQTELARLQAERSRLPEGSPLRKEYDDRIARLGQAPSTTVNIEDKAGIAPFITSLAKERDVVKGIPNQLENLQYAKSLIPEARTLMGPGGEALMQTASFLKNRLGFQFTGMEANVPAEKLRSALFEGVLQNLRQVDAQPTQKQQDALQAAIGKIGSDPDALVGILDQLENKLRSRLRQFNKDASAATASGFKFPFPVAIEEPAADQSSGARRGSAPSGGTVTRFDKDGNEIK